ncbi:hypothetical protein [Halocynthiibacter sp.]|uniref:hypothetical protein n=1 Tax=Halocynthiibacter sp. TaxID=1979210 RepID=UPI003C6B26D7
MTDAPDLLPCPNPWCIDNKRLIVWDLFSKRVICTCGIKGPRSATKADTNQDTQINNGLEKTAITEAIEAWNTRADLAPVVKVKPCNWRDNESATYGGPWIILHTAHGSPSGQRMWRGKDLGYKHGTTKHLGYEWHEARDAAKAAAQSHHDAQVRAMIE